MGQQEILNVLDEKSKLTAEEISEIIDATSIAVRTSLNRMLKHQEVKRIKLTKKQVEKNNKSYSGRHYVWIKI